MVYTVFQNYVMTYQVVDAASEKVVMGWTASTHDNRGGQQLDMLGHLTLKNLQLVLSEFGCHDLHPDGPWWWSINLSTQYIHSLNLTTSNAPPPNSQQNTTHTQSLLPPLMQLHPPGNTTQHIHSVSLIISNAPLTINQSTQHTSASLTLLLHNTDIHALKNMRQLRQADIFNYHTKYPLLVYVVTSGEVFSLSVKSTWPSTCSNLVTA